MAQHLHGKQVMQLALDGSPDPTLAFDPQGQIIYSNLAARSLFEESCRPGSHITDLVAHFPSDDSILLQFQKAAHQGRAFVTDPMPVNTSRLYRRRFIPVMSQEEIVGVYLYLRDTENRIEPHGGLTQTNNLELFLETELEKSARDLEDRKIALFMIQIRNFKELQALYGSAVTSTIMEHIRVTIRGTLRDNDFLFPIGEDRIIAVVTRYAWKSDLLIIAQRIEDQIAVPFHTRETVLHLLPSIGIAMYPDDGVDRRSLLSNVETTLNRAVDEELPFLMFNPRIHQEAMDRLIIRGDLNRAIRDQELQLYYMPIVDRHKKVVGMEALLRWNHPERGMMHPHEFLPIAIHSKIIGHITRWVLYKVVEHQTNELADFPVYTSFNISALDLADSYFMDSLRSAMSGKLPASRIRIELTENEIMSNFKANSRRIELLQNAGYEVMVDDFGTGHSSLTYLNELPARYIKIDRSFLTDIFADPSNMEFLKLAIELGRVRGKKVVLEGVETSAHWDALSDSGADLFMGYAVSKPLPVSKLTEFLMNTR